MLSLQQLSLSYAPAAVLSAPRSAPRSVPKMETVNNPITPIPLRHGPHAHTLPHVHAPGQKSLRRVLPQTPVRQAADLASLAKQLNPTVGFYDPLGFAKSGMGEAGTLASEEAVIGFLRQARSAAP